mmetsp:Transcript_6929/g.9916  ORF Transcript_6929/g.9916 Transcript_6929/m.9916 type:complete len:202 (+) Transcript_6929:140-745(+)
MIPKTRRSHRPKMQAQTCLPTTMTMNSRTRTMMMTTMWPKLTLASAKPQVPRVEPRNVQKQVHSSMRRLKLQEVKMTMMMAKPTGHTMTQMTLCVSTTLMRISDENNWTTKPVSLSNSRIAVVNKPASLGQEKNRLPKWPATLKRGTRCNAEWFQPLIWTVSKKRDPSRQIIPLYPSKAWCHQFQTLAYGWFLAYPAKSRI